MNEAAPIFFALKNKKFCFVLFYGGRRAGGGFETQAKQSFLLAVAVCSFQSNI